MAQVYDVVVAGAGHNSLTAAAYLAKAGMKVLVLERNAWIGGGVVTREVTLPGFKHDTHSTSHGVIQANPLIRQDELGLQAKYGLEYKYPDPRVATIFDDRTSLITWFDVDKTCESIAQFSARDADSYRKLAEKMKSILPMFVQGMFAPPLPFGSFISMLDMSPEGRELIGIMNRSAFDLIDRLFESEKVKIHFLKYASEHMTAPEEKGTGLVFYMMIGLAHSFKGGVPVGGSGSLTAALARFINDKGGEILTGRHVSKLLVEGGKAVGVRTENGEEFRARRAVIGCFHPQLLDHYVDGLGPELVEEAKHTQAGSYSALVAHYALNESPIFPALEGIPPPVLIECLPSNLEEVRQEFDLLRYGRMPKKPTLLAVCHSRHDSTRAPDGKATLYMYNFAPYQLAGGLNWDEEKERLADWMLQDFRKYTSNMSERNILARHVQSPLDMERSSLSFRKGDIMGIGQYLYQFAGRRPIPELSQFGVPGIESLYLSGPFMHPGGGVSGGGRGVAVKMLSDMDVDFGEVIGG
jgi:phytoene dehydrogenase-like protein